MSRCILLFSCVVPDVVAAVLLTRLLQPETFFQTLMTIWLGVSAAILIQAGLLALARRFLTSGLKPIA